MQKVRKILSLISLFLIDSCSLPRVAEQKANHPLPLWITASSDSNKVICSADGLDPQEIQVRAESNCLASAARSQGVTLRVEHKTVISLSGSDSGESITADPINSQVKCDFTNRFLEQLSSGGYRIWLQCGIRKNEAISAGIKTESWVNFNANRKLSQLPYKRAVLQITTVPQAEKIIIGGLRGERVFDVESNVMSIEVREGDAWVECKKQKYKSERKEIPKFSHGSTVGLTVYLLSEI